jgi:hypothetical protein
MNLDHAIKIAQGNALNKIKKMYHPKFKFKPDEWVKETFNEQRDYMVSLILDNLELEVKKLKLKNKIEVKIREKNFEQTHKIN